MCSLVKIHNNWLPRCSTAKGSETGLSLVGPTKVKPRKSFLLTEGSLKKVPLRLKIVTCLILFHTLFNLCLGFKVT